MKKQKHWIIFLNQTHQSFLRCKDYAEKLSNKLETFRKVTRTKKQLFLAFIASSGIKKNKYSDALVTNVVTLDDLFKE